MVDAFEPEGDAPGVRRAGVSLSRGAALYEWVLILLVFTSFAAGAIAFGGVRLWSIGPLSTLVALAGFFWFARPLVFRVGVPWSIPPGLPAMLVFLVYAIVVLPYAEVSYAARLNILMMATAPLTYAIYANLAGRSARWKTLILLLLIWVIGIGSYAILQELWNSPMVLTVESPYVPRRSGSFLCPNHFASLMAMGASLSLALLFTPELGVALKLVAGYVIAVATVGIYFSQSRSGMLGLASGVVTVLILTAWRRGRRALAIALLVIGPIGTAGAGWALYRYSPIWKVRIAAAVNGKESRPILWRDSFKMARESPVIGRGGGSYRWIENRYHSYSPGAWAIYAHNEYVHTIVEYGGLGLVLILIPAGVIAVRLAGRVHAARRPRNAMIAVGAVAVLAAGAVHAFFDFNFHIFSISQFALAVLGVAAAVLHADGEFKNYTPGRRATRMLSWGGMALCAALAILMGRATVCHFILRKADPAADAHAYDRARSLYQAARAWDPANGAPWCGLGRIAKNQAVYQANPADQPALFRRAEEYYLRADALNPWDPAVPHGLSEVYERTGRHEEALACLERLVRDQPRRPFYHTRLGAQLRRMGRLEEAREAFRRSLALDARDPSTLFYLRAVEAQIKAKTPPPNPSAPASPKVKKPAPPAPVR